MVLVFLRLQTEQKSNINKLIIKKNFDKSILQFNDIIDMLISIGFNNKEIINFNYYIQNNNIEKKLNLELHENKLYIIELKFKLLDPEFKKKAYKIFIKNSIIIQNEKKRLLEEEQNRQKDIENKKLIDKDIIDVYHINSEKLITKNKNFMNQLNNSELLYLLKIFKKKPELFEQMYQLVSNQTAIKNIDFNKIDLNNFKDYENKYSNFKKILINFKLSINEDMCKKILIHFEGNFDRTFRYLLSECFLE